MGVGLELSALLMHPLVDSLLRATGPTPAGPVAVIVIDSLRRQFSDPSRNLERALHRSTNRAWSALEVALAGKSWWDGVRTALTSAEDKSLAQRMRAFLDGCDVGGARGLSDEVRQRCLKDLQDARKKQFLNPPARTDDLLTHLQPLAALQGKPDWINLQWEGLARVAGHLKQNGHSALGQLLAHQAKSGESVLVLAARYYFRREVETHPELARGLTLKWLERLDQQQTAGLTAMAEVFEQHARRLRQLLDDVLGKVTATHDAVLDLRKEVDEQGKKVEKLCQDVLQNVLKALEDHRLENRSLQPRDSLSFRDETERSLVKKLVADYRKLPEDRRRQLPALLHGLGKLQVIVGDFDEAQKDFEQVSKLVAQPSAQAEAHYNAYRAALEQRKWPQALVQLHAALKLDPDRFAPFRIDDYEPERILGAGGFGVAFLCKSRTSGGKVVVKALLADHLDREVDEVLQEAAALEQVSHDNVIRLRHSGFADRDRKRAYLVMDYFEALTLEEHVQMVGPLSAKDLCDVGRQIAEGLHAAHKRGILHRDVKPGNVLVRQVKNGWEVKLIDFGLAMRPQTVSSTVNTGNSLSNTVFGKSVAGTLDYAAPEQMGKLPNVKISSRSDVYGFGKTCCYALFKTPSPLGSHWRTTPTTLADLLEKCLAPEPQARPANFADVLKELGKKSVAPPPPPPPPPPAEPERPPEWPVLDEIKVPIKSLPQEASPVHGLPPLALDLLEKEGFLVGLEHALREMQQGASACLAGPQGLVRKMEAQAQDYRARALAHTPNLPAEQLGRLAQASAQSQDGTVTANQLSALGITKPHKELKPFLDRLQNETLAERALNAVRKQYQDRRVQAEAKIRTKMAEVEAEVRTLQEKDLDLMMDQFVESLPPTPLFPIDQWRRFEKTLRPRRYRISMDGAEQRANRKLLVLADNSAYLKTSNTHSEAGYEKYLSDWPHGLHVAKARQALDDLRRARHDREWAKAVAANTIEAFEQFLREWMNSSKQKEAEAQLAWLYRESLIQKPNDPVRRRRYLKMRTPLMRQADEKVSGPGWGLLIAGVILFPLAIILIPLSLSAFGTDRKLKARQIEFGPLPRFAAQMKFRDIESRYL